jgi:peptidoglycan/LPS O-acetylase OafA/YrhL
LRIDQLTFTRFLAAIAIVIFHYGTTVFPFSHGAVHFLVSQANCGVSYFFVLSGFIMIVAYGGQERIDTKDYLKNRFARVYPLVALSALPYFFIALKSDRVHFTDVLLNLTTLQSWIPGKATAGNYPLWSITVEVFFYLCFPLFFNTLYKRFSLASITVSALILLAASVGVQHYLLSSGAVDTATDAGHDLVYYFPPMHLAQFVVGNVAGLFFLRNKAAKHNYDIPVLLCVILLVATLKLQLLYYNNGKLALFFAALIYFLAGNTGFITKVLNQKPLIFLGEISFAVYVLQAPVYAIVKLFCQKILPASGEATLFWLGLAALIIASAIAHIFIEKPLRNRIKAWRLKPVK